MNTFAIGDIHGGYKALKQCLNAAQFKYAEDQLIVLGDVCDGWPQTRECVDELLQIKNLIFVRGNHDYWVQRWMVADEQPKIWTTQGGLSTMKSYKEGVPNDHLAFFTQGCYYHIDEKNRIFVHGGFDRKKTLLSQGIETFMWDRELVTHAHHISRMGGDKPKKLTEFEEVFVGHTPVSNLGGLDTPLNFFEIWALDTGGGWEGKITIMNVDTHEYWQSDVVHELYPGEHGRQGKRLRQGIMNS